MSHSEYSHEDFERDFNSLLESGLIEVVGINKEGQWLYGPTESGKKMIESMMESGLLDELQAQRDIDE